tara:strand:+ start:12721 stop:12945 length:225 start_codon:yes stop_codon:yes gene_type:complete
MPRGKGWDNMETALLKYVCMMMKNKGESPRATALFYCIRHNYHKTPRTEETVMTRIKKLGYSSRNKWTKKEIRI